MGLFDFLKNKPTTPTTFTSGSYFETDINDADLKVLINNAIDVFQNNPDFDYNQIIDTIKTYRDDENLALALYRFIPIAYCRILFPEPVYSNEYVVVKNEKDKQIFSLSTDKIYTAVLNESKAHFAVETAQDKIVSILIHSADFKAINTALQNGSELKDLVCSASYFL